MIGRKRGAHRRRRAHRLPGGPRAWLAVITFMIGVWLVLASIWLNGQVSSLAAPPLVMLGMGAAGACFAAAIYEITGE